ncbi:MAG: hypothetical protein AAF658_20080, partial [Myxococcota bacterium]
MRDLAAMDVNLPEPRLRHHRGSPAHQSRLLVPVGVHVASQELRPLDPETRAKPLDPKDVVVGDACRLLIGGAGGKMDPQSGSLDCNIASRWRRAERVLMASSAAFTKVLIAR